MIVACLVKGAKWFIKITTERYNHYSETRGSNKSIFGRLKENYINGTLNAQRTNNLNIQGE